MVFLIRHLVVAAVALEVTPYEVTCDKWVFVYREVSALAVVALAVPSCEGDAHLAVCLNHHVFAVGSHTLSASCYGLSPDL